MSDLFNLSDYNVVEADYVIIRGVELKNVGIHGVLIRECSMLWCRTATSPEGGAAAARASRHF